MKKWFRRIALTALVIIAAFSMCMVSFAASSSSKKKITSIKIKINMDSSDFDEEDDSIEEDGLDRLITNDDSRDLYSFDVEFASGRRWEYGKNATIRVTCEISDKDKYKFGKISADDIKIDGTKYVESKSVSSRSDSKVVIRLRLKAYISDLEDPDGIDWDGKTAKWDKVTGATYYNVRLYRGSTQVATISTKKTSCDLYPGMTQTGSYKFRVQAVNAANNVKSGWSESSDSITIASNKVYRGTETLTGEDVTANNTSQASGSGPAKESHSNGWSQDSAGWRYLENGSAVMNSWRQVNGAWYYLGDRGYMLTGWISDGGRWYYLNPVSDGTKGAMQTGWLHDTQKNVWYYLNPVSDGTRGAMMTGYQRVNGRVYYFDTSSGAMWVSRRTPDGRYAGTDGNV